MGYFDDYSLYTKDQKSPDEFHLFTSIGIAASAAERRYSIKRGHFKLYPNLYTVLVAPSGKCAKSTALRAGVDRLRATGDYISSGIYSTKITMQALTQKMLARHTLTGDSAVTIVAPELGTFFSTDSVESSMLQFITDAYDSSDRQEYITKNKGEFILQNVCVNMLGATAPEWIPTFMPKSLIGGGTMGRILWVFKDSTDRCVPHPFITPEAEAAGQRITERLARIVDNKGEFEWAKPAHMFYDRWYRKYNVANDNADPRYFSYLERKPDIVIKIAMLYDLVANEPTGAITIEALEFALGILSYVDIHLGDVYLGLLDNKQVNDADAVHKLGLRLLKQGKGVEGMGIPWRLLCTRLSYKLSTEEIIKAIAQLEATGRVKRHKEKNASGRTIEFFLFTQPFSEEEQDER